MEQSIVCKSEEVWTCSPLLTKLVAYLCAPSTGLPACFRPESELLAPGVDFSVDFPPALVCARGTVILVAEVPLAIGGAAEVEVGVQ